MLARCRGVRLLIAAVVLLGDAQSGLVVRVAAVSTAHRLLLRAHVKRRLGQRGHRRVLLLRQIERSRFGALASLAPLHALLFDLGVRVFPATVLEPVRHVLRCH